MQIGLVEVHHLDPDCDEVRYELFLRIHACKDFRRSQFQQLGVIDRQFLGADAQLAMGIVAEPSAAGSNELTSVCC